MSIQKINEYYRKIADAKQFSGSQKETSLSRYFANLLSEYAQIKKLDIVNEVKLKNINKVPDGALLDRYKMVYGYWEAKDLQDDLEKEIIKKINIGYPTFNILFENGYTAILYQNNERVLTCDMQNPKDLHNCITQFISFEHPEAQNFKIAIAQFSKDTPDLVKILRDMMSAISTKEQDNINEESNFNAAFVQTRKAFFEMCQTCINPSIKYTDIDEMIIQHILTQDIFKTVFSNTQINEENNIATLLNKIEKTFFVGDLKANITHRMRNYYMMLKNQATRLETSSDRQDFLKAFYEDFYKAYNPKTADKLGIVYTPSVIVRFMIKTTDYLLEKHFDKNLLDDNVHILDPATGTGTFITNLLDYMPQNNADKFKHKFKNEIHANELSILPYYIAHLNIEQAYHDKMQTFASFDNLCWVDTLDNIDALHNEGQQTSFAGSMNEENYQRIKNQNERKISIIIGNPPYNANQQNENDDNKNREYFTNSKKTEGVDGRIKDTYIKYSTAQKTKQYDMYKRFFRWASDRMKNDGIIAFITNRAFITSAQDDGFRKCLKEEFQEIHIVDLKGDVRANDTKQGGNVFDIMTGVAISFLIKNKERENSKIYYYNIGDYLTKEQKNDMLRDNDLKHLKQEKITPDPKHNWIDLSTSDFQTLIPLVMDKAENEKKEQENEQETGYKVGKTEQKKLVVKQQIFNFSTLGVSTNRDEWVFDFDKENLIKKSNFFVKNYNNFLNKHLKTNTKTTQKGGKNTKDLDKKTTKLNLVNEPTEWDTVIKWSSDLKAKFRLATFLEYNQNRITTIHYRPFIKKWYYAEKPMSDRITKNHYAMFGENLDKENLVISFSSGKRSNGFHTLATNLITNLDIYLPDATNCIPLYIYENGERKENVSDWSLDMFKNHYEDTEITKLSIFHYVYAVLHNPAYREKYALDLKRSFPKVPLYEDFWQYSVAGAELMALHIDFSACRHSEIMRLKVTEKPLTSLLPKRKNTGEGIFGKNEGEIENEALLKKIKPEVRLKRVGDTIEIDTLTTIHDIPAQAWAYRLGNRSAIEWVLDQYKPYKSTDKSIQEKFNGYDFFKFKEEVIKLLKEVIYISVETMEIVKTLN